MPRLVVGVGASADGLDAFKQLLRALPDETGMAFLLVQHLDPAHDSLLCELLASHTKMRVKQAVDGDELAANTIYIIQPGTALAVAGQAVRTSEPALHRGIRLPVDHLLRSLAREYGARSVGIVLSGAGSDGCNGIRELRAAGGLTIAQDPRSSAIQRMPQSSINSGVDLVLKIAEIPAALERFASLPPRAQVEPSLDMQSNTDNSKPSDLIDSDFNQLAALLEAQSGFDLRVYKSATVERRLFRRMGLLAIDTMQDYLDLLREDRVERQTFIRDLLISVTDLFRDPQAFRTLRAESIDPLIHQLKEGSVVRVWVPGCATGEEAYSIGIEILEAIETSRQKMKLQIFATDIDHDALSFARAAVYPPSIAERMSAQRLETYFRPLDGKGYQVKGRLRDAVSFAAHDVTKDPPFSRMHLVSCRNLLIYLTPRAQERVLQSLHFSLQAGRHLFLGTSESTGANRELFSTISKPCKIFKKLGASKAIRLVDPHRSHRRARREPGEQSANVIQLRPADEQRRDESARQVALDVWAPPSIVVAEDGRILFMHGELGRFLRFPQGEDPRLDLKALLRSELASRTRAALYRCRRDAVTVTAVTSTDGTPEPHVKITASPASSLGDGAVLLSFQHIEEARGERSEDVNPSNDSIVEQMKKELFATQEDLRNTVEELETSNEELRSSNEESMSMNEELQSANEELEATTEELRSLNEALTTVNAQLREKVEQLEKTHDDVNNFFSSTKIATIFLDDHMCLKRFTPAAQELLSLTHGDIGRHIANFSRHLLQGDLEQEARKTLEDFSSTTTDQIADGQRWFSRRVLPYRTEGRHVEGVVITWTDVTETRQINLALQENEERFRLAAEAAKFGTFDTNLESGVTTWTQPLKALFGLSTESLSPQSVVDEGYVHPEDAPRVKQLLEESLDPKGGGLFEDEYRIQRKDGEDRWISVKAQTLFRDVGKVRVPVRSLGVALDVTNRKRAEAQLKESEAQLRRLFDQAPVLIALHEGDAHTYTYANPAYRRALGSDELEGVPLRSAFTQIDNELYQKYDHVLSSGESVLTPELPLTLKDRQSGGGEKRCFTQILEPWYDAAGVVAGVMSFAFDVTAEVSARHRAEESEHRLQLAKEAAALGVHDYNIAKNEITWDDRIYELWGVPRSEDVSYQTFVGGIHPDDREAMQSAVEQALQVNGTRHFESEYRVVHRETGEVKWINATGKVHFEGVSPVRLIGTVADATPHKEIERQLREADRQKDEFLSMLGHELRNPLAAICTASEVLGHVTEGRKEVERIQGILERQTGQIAKLLDGLLDVSRIVRGKIRLEWTQFDLCSVCRDIAHDAEDRASQRQLDLEVKLPEDPLCITADEVRVTQIIDNLLSNAMKYTPDGGWVCLSAWQRDERVIIKIEDSGVGIEEELLPHIFDMFRQSKRSLDRAQGGLGIGLALVKSLTEMHGGTVRARSGGERKGTTFEVSLPANAVEKPGSDARHPHCGTHGLRAP